MEQVDENGLFWCRIVRMEHNEANGEVLCRMVHDEARWFLLLAEQV
jgi:hypothetical protein